MIDPDYQGWVFWLGGGLGLAMILAAWIWEAVPFLKGQRLVSGQTHYTLHQLCHDLAGMPISDSEPTGDASSVLYMIRQLRFDGKIPGYSISENDKKKCQMEAVMLGENKSDPISFYRMANFSIPKKDKAVFEKAIKSERQSRQSRSNTAA
ncbi:hypothetical protein [Maricaulis sp.]|uniref:hypothetical protein n=1 Tax=Maricaulis sp. TaxID=1486257 RepID=UPI0025BDBC94|nr:hypothetical protein [Maricaulis sp.]